MKSNIWKQDRPTQMTQTGRRVFTVGFLVLTASVSLMVPLRRAVGEPLPIYRKGPLKPQLAKALDTELYEAQMALDSLTNTTFKALNINAVKAFYDRANTILKKTFQELPKLPKEQAPYALREYSGIGDFIANHNILLLSVPPPESTKTPLRNPEPNDTLSSVLLDIFFATLGVNSNIRGKLINTLSKDPMLKGLFNALIAAVQSRSVGATKVAAARLYVRVVGTDLRQALVNQTETEAVAAILVRLSEWGVPVIGEPLLVGSFCVAVWNDWPRIEKIMSASKSY